MNTIKVAINGCGRVGRGFFNLASESPDVEVIAVNDLSDIDNIAYLMNYDSAYGRRADKVTVRDDKKALIENGREILFFQEKDPSNLPWGDIGVDVVVESTGFFTKYKDAETHIKAGAKRVVISAPAKDEPTEETHKTILMGINDDELSKCIISSNASCTTNAGSPLIHILNQSIGIDKALLNTVHAYTASQSSVDSVNSKNPRLGRASGQNIVPTSTGAAKALTLVMRDLEGKFDGIALRVPVIAGSIADITFISKRDTSVEEVNEILENSAKEEKWKNIFSTTREPLVSSDIKGMRFGSIADLSFTRVVGGNLVKVLAWYDNEMGYNQTLLEHVKKIGKTI